MYLNLVGISAYNRLLAKSLTSVDTSSPLLRLKKAVREVLKVVLSSAFSSLPSSNTTLKSPGRCTSSLKTWCDSTDTTSPIALDTASHDDRYLAST